MVRQVELVRMIQEPPPPGATRPQFDGLPDYQRHAGSNWDFGAATQFALMFFLGLRQDHYLLDIGCGSLRVGRLLMVYLLPGHYYGVEPHRWAIDVMLEEEVGREFLSKRKPVLSDDSGFNLSAFGREFDFILAHSIFTHATQAQVRKCLNEVAKALKPMGIFAATYSAGESDYGGNEWAWPNCISYQPATMLHFVEEAGLMAQHMAWPLFNPKGQHELLLIGRPEVERLLFNKVAARVRGAITTWEGPWTRS
jgi:SAM-dependent methyltransferase